ncbi:MAG: hypothetical protein NC225_08040 [Clostridium sp.]|nr:hypothetical protein [Clostridium sp.]MCM1399412.1 hypothetical protein [Clostridium sp.]MCM1459966.1 hypothetical protein [Bacteroides sp.]
MATQGTNDGGSGMNRAKGKYNGPKKSGTRNAFEAGNGGYSNRKPKQGNSKYQPRYSGKDEDDDDNGKRSRPSRPKENKNGVSLPDKNKTMLRLEKEQKSIKKKQSRKKESSRPQPKVKRANNVNYTRSYANGDYDDYEEYYE